MNSGKLVVQFVTLAGLLAIAPHPCFASTMLVSNQVVEVMMQNQVADAASIARAYGADGSSLIHFQSVTDPTAGTFQYSTLPGSTYLGRGLSIAGAGAYDSGSGMWAMETAGSLGGAAWTQDGSGAIVGDPLGAFDWKIPIGGGHFIDFHSIVDYTVRPKDPETADSKGSYKFTIDNVVILSGSTGTDVVTQTAKNHMWHDRVDNFKSGGGISSFVVDSDGSSPSSGGIGEFTMRISPVPEPASLSLIGAGLLLLGGLGRRRRTRHADSQS